MDLQQTQSLAISLIRQHNLIGWSFDFDRAKRRLGCCFYSKKLITLSAPLVLLNDESHIRNTILHEISHGLVGQGHGHNYVWKRKAIEVGAKPERCFSEEVIKPQFLWVGYCPGCNKEYGFHRRPKKVKSCGRCNPRFDSRYIIQFENVR